MTRMKAASSSAISLGENSWRKTESPLIQPNAYRPVSQDRSTRLLSRLIGRTTSHPLHHAGPTPTPVRSGRISRQPPEPTIPSPAAIGLPAMRHSHHQDHKRIGKDFIHDAIVASTHSPQAAQLPFQRTARQRVFSQSIDRPHNAKPIRTRNTSQFPGCAPLNPNRVIHA